VSLKIVVVSPARPVFTGEASKFSVEALHGQMGVRPGHADIVAALGIGPLKITTGAGEVRYAVWGGFLKVGKGGHVTILVDRAEAGPEVDEAAARKELEETNAALRHPKSEEDFRDLLEKRAWCQTRIKLNREAPLGVAGR